MFLSELHTAFTMEQTWKQTWNVGARCIKASVKTYQGEVRVHLRHYAEDRVPTKKGVALTAEEWKDVKLLIPNIDAELLSQQKTLQPAISTQPSPPPPLDNDDVFHVWDRYFHNQQKTLSTA